jgi:hypothetical protein
MGGIHYEICAAGRLPERAGEAFLGLDIRPLDRPPDRDGRTSNSVGFELGGPQSLVSGGVHAVGPDDDHPTDHLWKGRRP